MFRVSPRPRVSQRSSCSISVSVKCLDVLQRRPRQPILVAHLLPVVEARLIELLKSLEPADWETQTIAPAWNVKDVAAHLLDTQLRKLSRVRDGYAAGPPPRFTSADDFVAFINRLNREGVEMYRPAESGGSDLNDGGRVPRER